jgi:integrase
MKHKNRTRGKTASRQLFEEAEEFFKKTYPNRRTCNTYADSYRKYIRFCREQFGCTTKDECAQHIGEYSAHLQKSGYSASTIHTYLAAVCVYHGVDMREIEKPKRHSYDYKRGRSNNGRVKRSDNDCANPKYERTVSFQSAVGIRRAELLRLTGDDFVVDESGLSLCPCKAR